MQMLGEEPIQLRLPPIVVEKQTAIRKPRTFTPNLSHVDTTSGMLIAVSGPFGITLLMIISGMYSRQIHASLLHGCPTNTPRIFSNINVSEKMRDIMNSAMYIVVYVDVKPSTRGDMPSLFASAITKKLYPMIRLNTILQNHHVKTRHEKAMSGPIPSIIATTAARIVIPTT